ncbi:radical SAM (seleno)protein TrsS [Syntrophotalea carbinolica]
MTESLCPTCLQRVAAERVVENDVVWLVKTCPEHGTTRTVLWRGAPLLSDWQWPKIPSRPPVCFTEPDRGCPYDCGLCSNHGQHTCSALLEITERCNMACPVCFADSGKNAAADPTLETIDGWLQAVGRASGFEIVIQLSGGEPTVREDLPEIIRRVRQRGFGFVQINTNGLRLAEDPAYARQLYDAGLTSVFLQFDGTSDEIYRQLRGRDLYSVKVRAIEHAVRSHLGVVLVPTLVPGINQQDVGNILRFGMQYAPGVRGVHFQPVSYFGRYPQPPENDRRLTLPEIIRSIAEQTEGLFQVENFSPPGCEHSHCSFHGNFVLLENGDVCALGNNGSACCSKPTPAAEGAEKSKAFLTRQWAAPEVETPAGKSAGPQENCCRSPRTPSLDEFLQRVKTHTFAVSAMAFQDVWNVDLERTRNCCIHVVSPDGRLVPFCLYNLTSADGEALHRGKWHANNPA